MTPLVVFSLAGFTVAGALTCWVTASAVANWASNHAAALHTSRRRAPAANAALVPVTRPAGRLGVPPPLPRADRLPIAAPPAHVVVSPRVGRWHTDTIELRAVAGRAQVSPALDGVWLQHLTPPARPAGVLDALRGGPLALHDLIELLGRPERDVYRELAGLLATPEPGRPVDFVAAVPGNPVFGLTRAALPT